MSRVKSTRLLIDPFDVTIVCMSTRMASNPTDSSINDESAHILLVDDDRRIRELLTRYLIEYGYRVSNVSNAADARQMMDYLVFDIIVLDIMMPGENGLEFVQALRKNSQIPVLMLTARTDVEDRMQGLEFGADDYLTKPFDPRELRLRIASILKRIYKPSALSTVKIVHFGAFSFDIQRNELRHKDQVVRLTGRERAVLATLAGSPNKILSREALGDSSSGTELSQERTIDVQINRLRRKIEAVPSNPLYLQTIRGLGYRLLIDRIENM